MISKQKCEEIIFKCAEELNKQLPEESKIILDESTAIIGKNSPLDSLGIVTLMISIEEHVAYKGIKINIMDVLTEANEPPFVSIGDMALWLLEQSS